MNVASTTILNEFGDIVIEWDEESHDEMVEVIQQKLDQGYVFFIIEKKFFNLFDAKKRIQDAKQIKNRKVLVEDHAFRDMILAGKAVETNHKQSYSAIRPAFDANEIASNHTVATPRLIGG